jgi:predicted dehydrogenase
VTGIGQLKAGVVGTGFIGVVHVDALHRLGIEVSGGVGSTPERAAAKRIAPASESHEALLDDDRVDVVHITTPNYLHHPQVKQALASGTHVVCEKPLAVTADQSAERVELAESSGLVHCTNFNIRFYPIVQEARDRVRAGELGDVWNVHGGYREDWLAQPTDWNWRLEPEKGGELRAVVSQVSTGRKNSLRFEIDGSAGALAWDSERNEEIWLGRLDGPNETLLRNAALMHPTAAARTHLPVAHAEGFADTFRELYRAVNADVARGRPSDEPDYPTFRDGDIENVLCDAVALSNRERRWVEVPR